MRQVTLHGDPDRGAVIEVDGHLDLVASHDLRHALESALATSVQVITLDLSRVSGADDDGIAALSWCCERATTARRALMWSGCSQPVRRDLQIATVRTRGGTRRPPLHAQHQQ